MGGPMLMECQKFAGVWAHNIMNNWFIASQCKTIHEFVKCSWEHLFIGKNNPLNPQPLIQNSIYFQLHRCEILKLINILNESIILIFLYWCFFPSAKITRVFLSDCEN